MIAMHIRTIICYLLESGNPEVSSTGYYRKTCPIVWLAVIGPATDLPLGPDHLHENCLSHEVFHEHDGTPCGPTLSTHNVQSQIKVGIQIAIHNVPNKVKSHAKSRARAEAKFGRRAGKSNKTPRTPAIFDIKFDMFPHMQMPRQFGGAFGNYFVMIWMIFDVTVT
jgi:hypothetical protein